MGVKNDASQPVFRCISEQLRRERLEALRARTPEERIRIALDLGTADAQRWSVPAFRALDRQRSARKAARVGGRPTSFDTFDYFHTPVGSGIFSVKRPMNFAAYKVTRWRVSSMSYGASRMPRRGCRAYAAESSP